MTRALRLLPAALALAALLAWTAPAARAAADPDHTLTYTTGALTWDSATGIDPNGAAQLRLFDAVYQNVLSQDGAAVVAPGTGGENRVRLTNRTGRTIRYVAVAYRARTDDDLPVTPALADGPYADTDACPLPEGVTADQVLRAVTGTLDGGQSCDFVLAWAWPYYESDARDGTDTALGNRAAWDVADEAMAGLYIVVTQESAGGPGPAPTAPEETSANADAAAWLAPTIPQTGDSAPLGRCLLLMGASGAAVLLLTARRRNPPAPKE